MTRLKVGFKRNKQPFLIACIFTAALLSIGSGRSEKDDVYVTLRVGEGIIKAKMARNSKERAKGLSSAEYLPENEGMLFVLPENRKAVFHMRGVHIPLTIAFIDGEGKLLEIRNMEPGRPEISYASPQDTRFALEVNQGWFERNRVREGDSVQFLDPIPSG